MILGRRPSVLLRPGEPRLNERPHRGGRHAEHAVAQNPESYPIHASLLADVTEIMLQQARSGLTAPPTSWWRRYGATPTGRRTRSRYFRRSCRVRYRPAETPWRDLRIPQTRRPRTASEGGRPSVGPVEALWLLWARGTSACSRVPGANRGTSGIPRIDHGTDLPVRAWPLERQRVVSQEEQFQLCVKRPGRCSPTRTWRLGKRRYGRGQIIMVKAGGGDCFVLQADDRRGRPWRAMDRRRPAGDSETRPQLPTLSRLDNADPLPLDLIAVTHVDNDHIGGSSSCSTSV